MKQKKIKKMQRQLDKLSEEMSKISKNLGGQNEEGNQVNRKMIIGAGENFEIEEIFKVQAHESN